MGISDLLSLILHIFRLKYLNKKKKVTIKNMNEFKPEAFNFRHFTFYNIKLDEKEYKKLNEFFILNNDNLQKKLGEIYESKKDFEIETEIKSEKKIKSDIEEIKFYFDEKNVVIIIPINDEKINIEKKVNKQIYGLGSKFAPFNRKRLVFDNFNTDNPYHAYFTDNLYSTYNIFYIYDCDSKKTDAYILDYPGFVRYDFCKTDKNQIRIMISAKAFQLLKISSNDFEDSVKMVYKIVNSFYKPPFHSFGYTYSHWGIKSIKQIQKIYDNHALENIPLSNICIDIDYMQDYKNFTINDEYGGFEKFKKISNELKEKNRFLIPIIDAAIKVENGYFVYNEFLKNGNPVKILKKNKECENFIGTVWPGKCIFPDYFNKKDYNIFKKLVKKWIEDTDTNGCWLDMNEPSIFDQKERTLPKNARFLNGSIENIKLHNMYPYFQAKVTYEAFLEKGIRPMLFSRSGYTFMGQFCGNWTGDNQPRFSHLKTGFQQIISLSLSAVMYTGTDIGGFWFNPSKKLLIKWFESALFHPLFRNHSSIFAKSRDLTLLNKKTKNKIKNVIEARYMLLPTIYSLFNCSIYYKKPYIMPYIYNDNGKTIINEDIVIISETIGFDPFDTNLLEKNKNYLPYKINDINLYIKKGKGIILNEKINPLKNIFETFPFTFVGNFDENNIFSLKIYFDDGISADSIDKFAIYKITVKKEKENQNLISFIKIFSNLEKEKESEIESNLKNSKIKTIN